MPLKSQINHNFKKGSVEVICGSMFSGKTEELLRRLKRAKFAKLNIAVFKPTVDKRYDNKKIVSHDKNKISATTIDKSEKILELFNQADIVAVDEAQFFDYNLVNVCNKLASMGVRVIITGLDMDFLGNPFGVMPNILAIAENITKVHAICIDCGEIANNSYRKSSKKRLVQIGEKKDYKALCRSCFVKNMQ
tara:strand:- start:221 stop:796 length:576 start_codon:yes stop_codon:yes gene_type:complete